ncbi:TrkH family potassium uptake protein [Flavobacterium sp. CS20]|uniref:TrkH family potassium uptake protein n=1 Tax=Flavobacterium sp. CS20 TaxID=2775246 RepID=UPI001B3A3875|nr:potassium transporter TrkG [Flavobacterium sp. CS20]QTY27986.1 ATPase [Flavobacterium sp. CS20]
MKLSSAFKILKKINIGLSVVATLLILFDFGFNHTNFENQFLVSFFVITIFFNVVVLNLEYVINQKKSVFKVLIFDIIFILFSIFLLLVQFKVFKIASFESLHWLEFLIFVGLVRYLSNLSFKYSKTKLDPSQIFVVSFIIIILFGTLALMLPNATYTDIGFIDALFTSTSAVCVTGLIVVDTSTFFTPFGQGIIMVLIQIGGLGILTIASYFSFFFKRGSSYESQLLLSEITQSNKVNAVFGTLKYIIGITFFVEAVSGVFIFFNVESSSFDNLGQHIFFSMFHSISAFCNAGFSTLSNSLYQTGYRFNYGLQLVVVLTFIFGGLGFPIVANIVSYLKNKFLRLFDFKNQIKHKPWLVNINSRLNLITTGIITLSAFVFFIGVEFDGALAHLDFKGKLVNALFTATTPRTAGFNTIDMAELAVPSILFTILLMWIGASPSSTGGGIKTSTIAVAVLNVFNLAQGKNKLEVFRREISQVSISRAFATIVLSLLIIGLSILSISIFNPKLNLLDVAFECFSAYSTVGLSLGITSSLSTYSKIIIILTMFIGRVSMLTIIVAIVKKTMKKNYNYPKEEILIT